MSCCCLSSSSSSSSSPSAPATLRCSTAAARRPPPPPPPAPCCRAMPSLAYMLPSPAVFPPGYTIAWSAALGRNYSAGDLQQLLQDAGASDAAQLWQHFSQLGPSRPPPGVRLFCMHGTGVGALAPWPPGPLAPWPPAPLPAGACAQARAPAFAPPAPPGSCQGRRALLVPVAAACVR
jgi:hypothetical protein